MKNSIITTLALVFLSLNALSQSIYVKDDTFLLIGSEDNTETRLDTLRIGVNGMALVKNTTLRVNVLITESDKPSVHVYNSVIIAKKTNLNGALMSHPKDNRIVSDLIEYRQGEMSILKFGKEIAKGKYDAISDQYLSQGVYEVYLNGKIIDIIYFI